MRARVVAWEERDNGPWDVIDSTWVHTFWAPILGPSAMMLWRQLVIDLSLSGRGMISVDLDDYGKHVGIQNPRKTRQTLDRLTNFGVMYADGRSTHVRTRVGLPAHRHREACWPSAVWSLQRAFFSTVYSE